MSESNKPRFSRRWMEDEVSAADLFSQQIWCWERDIESAEGNLLLRHGFERIEKPPSTQANSIYRLNITSAARIVLRGFGVFYGADDIGGIFVRRYGFSPQLTHLSDLTKPAWCLDDLPPLRQPTAVDVPSCQQLLLDLTAWVRQYEVWIDEQLGIAYRWATLAPWQIAGKSFIPAEEMAAAWRRLGIALANQPERYIVCAASRSHCHG